MLLRRVLRRRLVRVSVEREVLRRVLRSRKRAEYCFESTVSEKRNSLSFTANSVSSAKNSVSSLWHTNNRLRGTHWVRSPELSEPKKTHWVRCLKPYSPKPYSAHFRRRGGVVEVDGRNTPFRRVRPPSRAPYLTDTQNVSLFLAHGLKVKRIRRLSDIPMKYTPTGNYPK